MMRTTLPKRALALIAGVVAAGAACVAVRLGDLSRWTAVDLGAVLALAGLTIAAEQLSIRVPFGRETKHVTMTEAAFGAAMLLGVRASVLTVGVALGFAVGHALRGTAPHKLAFNVGSAVTAVTAAEVVFAALRGVSPVLGVAAGMGAFFVINASTVVGVIALASGRSLAATFAPIAGLEFAQAGGNLAVGMLAASAWSLAPAAVLAGVPAAVLMGLRSRAAAPSVA